jgi:hypothetical protein
MKRSRSARTPANLPASIQQQLTMYAIAAGAAGVGLLALAQPAEAKIVYTPADVKITKFHLDLDHDGVDDFLLQTSTKFVSQTSETFRLNVSPSNRQNDVWGKGNYASALRAGVRVGAGFPQGGIVMVSDVYKINSFYTKFHGPWANGGKGVKNRYLGLKFLVKGKHHFGWARLNVAINLYGQITATLTGYAYETTVGKSIKAGQTHSAADDSAYEDLGVSMTSPVPDTPQPASLGMLAMGAPGLSIWRRESVGATP